MKRKKYWNKWVTGVILLLCSMFLCPDVRAEGNENLPDNPYVYAALTREAILAWDVPDSSESGSYSYTLCEKQGDGGYVPVENGTGIDPSKGYFTLYKLKPDTTYTFAFQGQSPGGGSVMGADIHLATRHCLLYTSWT